jgi:hypothetical protein
MPPKPRGSAHPATERHPTSRESFHCVCHAPVLSNSWAHPTPTPCHRCCKLPQELLPPPQPAIARSDTRSRLVPDDRRAATRVRSRLVPHSRADRQTRRQPHVERSPRARERNPFCNIGRHSPNPPAGNWVGAERNSSATKPPSVIVKATGRKHPAAHARFSSNYASHSAGQPDKVRA